MPLQVPKQSFLHTVLLSPPGNSGEDDECAIFNPETKDKGLLHVPLRTTKMARMAGFTFTKVWSTGKHGFYNPEMAPPELASDASRYKHNSLRVILRNAGCAYVTFEKICLFHSLK